MPCPALTSSVDDHSFKQARLVFAGPDDGRRDSETPPAPPASDTLATSQIRAADEMRDRVTNTMTPTKYPFGKRFSLAHEVEVGNISRRAAEFIGQFPSAEECIRNYYEHDAFTYIHVGQMVNSACNLVDEHLDAMKRVGMPEGFSDEELKKLFVGATIFHDWGKIRVPVEVLNGGRGLSDEQKKQMRDHMIHTIDILVPEHINEGSSELEKLMAYTALSHHRHRKNRDARMDYPTEDEIETALPGYAKWFKAQGEGICTILAILDSNDALLSPRSYKEGFPPSQTLAILEGDYLYHPEDQVRYRKMVDIIFEHWQKMAQADQYKARRTALSVPPDMSKND